MILIKFTTKWWSSSVQKSFICSFPQPRIHTHRCPNCHFHKKYQLSILLPANLLPLTRFFHASVITFTRYFAVVHGWSDPFARHDRRRRCLRRRCRPSPTPCSTNPRHSFGCVCVVFSDHFLLDSLLLRRIIFLPASHFRLRQNQLIVTNCRQSTADQFNHHKLRISWSILVLKDCLHDDDDDNFDVMHPLPSNACRM